MALQPLQSCVVEMPDLMPHADYQLLLQASKTERDADQKFVGPIKSDWSIAAQKNGYSITGRIKDRLHVLLLCRTCRLEHKKRISVVMGFKPECPYCILKTRLVEARTIGARLLRRDVKSRHYGHYLLKCGHPARRQFHRVHKASLGGHNLGCDNCREQRYAEQATKHGWTLSGQTHDNKTGYRSYRHSCGHSQNIAVANMDWGDCACKKCSPGRTAKTSWIYIFRIDLPRQTVFKLGYSVRPQKRLKHQLGISKDLHTEVARTIKMPTGFDARVEEELAHRTMINNHPELVVPKSEFGDMINTKAEIYRNAAGPLIHELLDGIEARFPDTNSTS